MHRAVLGDHDSESNLASVRARVKVLTENFRLYSWKSPLPSASDFYAIAAPGSH